jgi:hypothetical protein
VFNTLKLDHYTVHDAVFSLTRIAKQMSVRLEIEFENGEVIPIEDALAQKPASREPIAAIRVAK